MDLRMPFPVEKAAGPYGNGPGKGTVRVPEKKKKGVQVSPECTIPKGKMSHVDETPKSKGHYPLDEHPDCACPDPWSSHRARIVHYIGSWDTCKVPGEQDRQSTPIRALRDVVASQVIHTSREVQELND